jgi:hypothetical protein
MNPLETLKQKLEDLERQIVETKKRLPAHSVKPPVMMDLLALEDEYQEVLSQIQALTRALKKP